MDERNVADFTPCIHPRGGASAMRRLSRSKRLLFTLLAAVGVYACIEFLALCALVVFYDGFSVNRQRQTQRTLTDPARTGAVPTGEILHPYLGTVRRPQGRNRQLPPEEQVSAWGFNDDQSPIQRRDKGKVIIGVLGGSVAEEFARGAGSRLCQELGQAPQFAGKELVLVRLALAGYKQPQQLMVVSYLLSQGAEFDLLLNIDGFNEAVLPALTNVPHGVFASYPQSWQIRMAGTSDPAVLRLIGALALRKELSQTWAARLAKTPARLSPTLLLIWRAYDDSLRRGMPHDYHMLAVTLGRNIAPGAMGPPQHFADPHELYARCADVWMQSSLQLHRLAASNGIRYYHFLQPNQYLPGSKTMGPAELSIAFNEVQPYRKPVEQGYPLLKRQGARLVELGVRFHDATRLFENEALATYRDTCCHYNARGNELLADEIARAILKDDASR